MALEIKTAGGECFTLDMTRERYHDIIAQMQTGHIQNIAPELPPCHREFFITGLGPHEFANLWGGTCTNWEAKANQCNHYKQHGKCLYEDIKLMTEQQVDELLYGHSTGPTNDWKGAQR